MVEMPDRLFAHLGAHKTASTFLQKLFLDHSGIFSAAGVHYIPRSTFFPKVTKANLQWRTDFQSCIPSLRSLTQELLPNWQPEALMISDESMSGHIFGDPGAPLTGFYMDCNRPVELLKRALGSKQMNVIFFVRAIQDFLESSYLQLVRQGVSIRFETYISGFDLERISWLPTIEKLSAPLSPGDKVWIYDHQSLLDDPQGVLTDLYARIGVNFPSDGYQQRRVNESFTPLQYKAVIGINRIFSKERYPGLRKKLILRSQLLRIRGQEKVRFFSEQKRQFLRERHRYEMAAIRAMGGIVACYPPTQ